MATPPRDPEFSSSKSGPGWTQRSSGTSYWEASSRTTPIKESLVKKYKHTYFSENSFTEFVANAYENSTKEASSVLESLAGVSFTCEKQEAVNLSGKFIRFKRLAQTKYCFDSVKADSEVTSRVPKRIASKTETCLIVGVMVCEDVEVEWSSEEKRNAEGHIKRRLDPSPWQPVHRFYQD